MKLRDKINSNHVVEFEKRITIWIETHVKFILISLILEVFIYFMMLSENLMNSNDALLHTSNYDAGKWEISLGRGMLHYLDKARDGIVSVPLNSILTLCIISIIGVLILELFSIENKLLKLLIPLILSANPVMCAILAYTYTSVNYGMAFLFAVLAVYCIYYGSRNMGTLAGGYVLPFQWGVINHILG